METGKVDFSKAKAQMTSTLHEMSERPTFTMPPSMDDPQEYEDFIRMKVEDERCAGMDSYEDVEVGESASGPAQKGKERDEGWASDYDPTKDFDHPEVDTHTIADYTRVGRAERRLREKGMSEDEFAYIAKTVFKLITLEFGGHPSDSLQTQIRKILSTQRATDLAQVTSLAGTVLSLQQENAQMKKSIDGLTTVLKEMKTLVMAGQQEVTRSIQLSSDQLRKLKDVNKQLDDDQLSLPSQTSSNARKLQRITVELENLPVGPSPSNKKPVMSAPTPSIPKRERIVRR
jgi:hypothetical protein